MIDDQDQQIMPPDLPAGYEALAAPSPLLRPSDERWIVPARRQASGYSPELDGVLIYEDRRVVVFLCSEEAMSTLTHLLEWTPYYFSLCEGAYLQEHSAELSRIHAVLEAEESNWHTIRLIQQSHQQEGETRA